MIDIFRGLTPRNIWLPFGVFAIGLILTGLAGLYIKAGVETAAQREFEYVCNEIQLNIGSRMDTSAQVLYSGAALFASSDVVSRDEWRTFTQMLRLDQHLPGTQGVGFSQLVQIGWLDQYIRQVRQEGFPDFNIWPMGTRETYTFIKFLEPFSGRNLRAFGFDMFSEPVRREAMQRARDENTAALSGKVILVQETGRDVQAGTLMYVPVYQRGMQVNTLEERRAAIVGWVYSPFRMNDMMDGTVGKWEQASENDNIILKIYDGDRVSADALLYDSSDPNDLLPFSEITTITRVVHVKFKGQPWTLEFSLLGGLSSLADYNSVWMVVIIGVSISLILLGLIISMLRTSYYLSSLKRLSEMDSLTGIFNRGKIIELAENEYRRAKRLNHSLTIVMMDINNFKQINDNYGHALGDQALRLTASAMQAVLRVGVDWIGRFGGDEFVIILPETDPVQVENIIFRLRENVKASTQNLSEGLSMVTISVGTADLVESIQSLDELLESADQAMYLDKKQSR